MRIGLIFFLIMVGSSLAGMQRDSVPEHGPNWEQMRSYDGRFALLTPGPMTEQVDTIETPIGEIVYHTFYYQPDHEWADNVVYMLSYCDYPAEAVHSDSTVLLQEFFANTIEAATDAVRGTLVYQDVISLERYPGRLWRIHYRDEEAMIKTRAYVVANRYYAVQTVTLKEKSLNPSADRYLDSFRLLQSNELGAKDKD